ncbi:hypothetical protein Tco_1187527, partial [Tanacetum coccineum]
IEEPARGYLLLTPVVKLFDQGSQYINIFLHKRWGGTFLNLSGGSGVHYILPGLSSKTQALWKLCCLLKASHKSMACIRLGLRSQSCLHAPSTGCGPDVCAIRTSYVSCTSSDGDNAPPPVVLLLTSSADCCSLPPEQTAAPYLLSRCYSLPPV